MSVIHSILAGLLPGLVTWVTGTALERLRRHRSRQRDEQPDLSSVLPNERAVAGYAAKLTNWLVEWFA